MRSSKPYFIRALFDWIVDNNCTPHIVVNALAAEVTVPLQHVKDGQIVLNIAPQAVMSFAMGKESISFSARFGGVPFQVYIPMAAIIAIHARENGIGTFFPPEPAYEAWLSDGGDTVPDIDDDEPPEPPKPSGRPSLRVVK